MRSGSIAAVPSVPRPAAEANRAPHPTPFDGVRRAMRRTFATLGLNLPRPRDPNDLVRQAEDGPDIPPATPLAALLPERARQIAELRAAAATARWGLLVRGLDEVAVAYGEAIRAVHHAHMRGTAEPPNAKAALVEWLERKASQLERASGAITDAGIAGQMRSLSAICGKEAARLARAA